MGIIHINPHIISVTTDKKPLSREIARDGAYLPMNRRDLTYIMTLNAVNNIFSVIDLLQLTSRNNGLRQINNHYLGRAFAQKLFKLVSGRHTHLWSRPAYETDKK